MKNIKSFTLVFKVISPLVFFYIKFTMQDPFGIFWLVISWVVEQFVGIYRKLGAVNLRKLLQIRDCTGRKNRGICGNSTNLAIIIFILLWNFLVFYQISLSPQVKRSAIISDKYDIYELSHEFPNDLRLRKLVRVRKISKIHRITSYCPVFVPK